MAASPVFPASIGTAGVTLVNADGTALKTLFTAGANGAKIVAISASNDDTGAKDIQLWLTIGGVDFLLDTKTVAASSGNTNAAVGVNLLDLTQMPWLPLDSDGQRYLIIPANAILKIKATVAVVAAKTMYFVVQASNF